LLDEKIMIGSRGDKVTEYGSIALLPGEYSFHWGRDFAISFLIDPDMHEEFWITQKIFVEPGYVYRLQSGRTTASQGYIRGYFWIENITTGYNVYPGCQTEDGKGVGTVLGLAEDGDSEAQYQLAKWYSGSKCFNQVYAHESDYEKSAYWFELAAEQGDERAQYEIARAFHTGTGVTLDLTKAREWYLNAAEQGNTGAEYQLGLFYHKGLGGEQNLEKAKYWYQKAANKNFRSAELGLELIQEEIECQQSQACQSTTQ
jgi:TPR repeat protein